MKDLSMHIMDIAQNSISALADLIKIEIHENVTNNSYSVIIEDNGKGMPAELLSKVTDPYVTTRTTRKVGLGLPLLRQNAERTGGSFRIESEEGKGTKVIADFILNNFDRPPLGDIAGTIVLLAAANLKIRFIYRHKTEKGEYLFDTYEINEMLDGMPISEAGIIRFLKEMINENLQEIQIAG